MNIKKNVSKISLNSVSLDQMNALEIEFKKIVELIDELERENYILTCSEETAGKWEQYLGIDYEVLELQERIKRILFFKNLHGNFTKVFVTELAKNYTGLRVGVEEFFYEYRFEVHFFDDLPHSEKLGRFRKELTKFKPAHLIFDVKFFQENTGNLLTFATQHIAGRTINYPRKED